MALLKLGVSLWVLLLLGVGRSAAEEEELVEAGEDLGEEEGADPYEDILDDLAVSHMAGPQSCDSPAVLGDRVYLEYAGIEHATGEVFSANTRASQLPLIVRLGEEQVLPGEYDRDDEFAAAVSPARLAILFLCSAIFENSARSLNRAFASSPGGNGRCVWCLSWFRN